ncbi:MAG: hypothetical protein ABI867_35485 [Kofleriaceae bacterium]
MHRILLIVALGGCWGTSRTPGRVAGGITAGVGAVMLVNGLTSNCEDHIEDLNDSVGCGITKDVAPAMGGAMVAIGALILLVNELRDVHYVERAEVTPPVVLELSPEPDVADPMLRQLTLQASVAARAGHCSTVTAIASRVERLDPAYRRDGFERDDKIASCLKG